MKTVIVGGGRGCRAILDLLESGHLRELDLDIVCVADPDPHAPGLAHARARGLSVVPDHRNALALPGVELVLELTGDADILAEIYHALPRGVRVIDHVMARVFWDLANLEQSLREELRTRAALQQQLAADRRRAQEILDSLPDLVLVLDADKRVRLANARFGELTGMPPEAAVGRGCRDVFCAGQIDYDCRESVCPFDRAMAEGRPVSVIVERRSLGDAFYEITACPRRDPDGRIREIVETHHPVTERMLLRREVETSERRFRQFIDSAHDIISIKDRAGRYLVFNQASAALFGRAPEEFLGKTAAELYSPDIAALITRHDQEVMRRREHATYLEHYRIEGRDHYLQTVRFPLLDYRGEVEGVCTIARDVTQERRLQQQLLHSAKLAAVGKLAAGVAHEINNPLTGVLAYAEDLRDDAAPDDPRRADYEVIVRETLRCRDIVRNLLDFARQEEPDIHAVDLNEVVLRALALVEKLPRFRNLGLERRLARVALPVAADSRQLQQVLLNLLINACEATDGEGRVIITSERLAEQPRATVSVADTGPGVPPEARERIFEPFFSTKQTSGLGLAVSWGIIERHGGAIEVRDRPGGGADFRITLPLAAGD